MEVGTNILREPFKAKPTPQEAELMMLAFVYAEHIENIDYEKIAEHFGYKSGTVAKDRLRQIKRKLFGPGGGAKISGKDKETPSKKRTRKAKAADDDDAEENGDGDENPTPTKKPRRKAAPKKKQLSEEKVEEDDDELPEKKPEAEAEDDDYAEDEV